MATIPQLPPKVIAKFWSRVDKSGSCWTWQGARGRGGYGRFSLALGTLSAHRLAYTLLVGSIPKGMCVCHRCDNPPCVNPDHLFVGTYRDNIRDMMQKGRRRTRKARRGTDGTLHCSLCRRILSPDQFTRDNSCQRGYRYYCKPCQRRRNQHYKALTPQHCV